MVYCHSYIRYQIVFLRNKEIFYCNIRSLTFIDLLPVFLIFFFVLSFLSSFSARLIFNKTKMLFTAKVFKYHTMVLTGLICNVLQLLWSSFIVMWYVCYWNAHFCNKKLFCRKLKSIWKRRKEKHLWFNIRFELHDSYKN